MRLLHLENAYSRNGESEATGPKQKSPFVGFLEKCEAGVRRRHGWEIAPTTLIDWRGKGSTFNASI